MPRFFLTPCLFSLLVLISPSRAAENAAGEVKTKTELYFGLARPGGKKVSSQEWTYFFESCVLPKFQEGLTLLDGMGQWKDADGKISSEPSKVLVLVYAPDEKRKEAIDSIVDAYKAKFGQQSVLEVTAPVTASFHLERLRQPAEPSHPLDDYRSFNDTPRENVPTGYIEFLKKSRFKNGELDNLPKFAVILYAANAKEYLKQLEESDATELELGTAVSNRIFVVRRKTGASYIVNIGLPGAGGVQVQLAELAALGVKTVIHVGTCVTISGVNDNALILSNGSYKDGAATMLAPVQATGISKPSEDLNTKLDALLTETKTKFTRATGYTIPIYYYQPLGLLTSLIESGDYGSGRAQYVEMEQAPFFESARHAKVNVASLVVVSDRYRLDHGALIHTFCDGTQPQMKKALETCRAFFDRMKE